jgi:excisionase family DNA binding protein
MGQKPLAVPSVIALPKLLNIKEVAHFLNVSVRTVHTIIKAKQLTHSRVRGQLRFDPMHVADYLQKRTVQAA